MALIAIQFESNEELLAFRAATRLMNPDVVVEAETDFEVIFNIPGEDYNVTYRYAIGSLFFEAAGVEI